MTLGILLVDPQIDFFPGGALPVADGDRIIKPINALLAARPSAPVFASRDWHAQQTVHFASGGGTWPVHCVAHSPGAGFHEALQGQSEHWRIYNKGTDPTDDGGYSAFEGAERKTGAPLLADLQAVDVDTLLVAGLASDYCVKASVLSACAAGLLTLVLLDGIAAVNVEPGDDDKALAEMVAAGALLISSAP